MHYVRTLHVPIIRNCLCINFAYVFLYLSLRAGCHPFELNFNENYLCRNCDVMHIISRSCTMALMCLQINFKQQQQHVAYMDTATNFIACFLLAHLVTSAAASSMVYFQFNAPVPSSFAQHRAARLTSCTRLYCLLRVLLFTATQLWLYYILFFTAAMSLYLILARFYFAF